MIKSYVKYNLKLIVKISKITNVFAFLLICVITQNVIF